ncbi:MAG TPA: Rossmann-like and DUF2520 domain-containing protein [Bacteroidales bacterium]|nr:Rossmann-like and DUF2520 domain-containing protein [Bacteroidales bacterium]
MLNCNEIKSVAIAGMGNVGIHFAKAFDKAGIKITHLFSRDPAAVSNIAKKYHCDSLKYGDKILSPPDLILLCVPDSVIRTVGNLFNEPDSIIAHVSGSTGLEALQESPSYTGVFYPLQTFSKDVPLNIENIPFCIEGSNLQTENLLKNLASCLSNFVYSVDSEQRKALHVSAVFACNFTNHLASISMALLEKSNLDFNMLIPLLEQTYNKLKTASPKESQTGPAIRGDQSTISDHIDFLKNCPEERELYRLLSENIKKYGGKTDE